MGTFNKFNDFKEQIAKGVHAFGTHTFKVFLSNELPLATDAVKSDIAEIAAGNGYTAGGVATTTSVSETGGVATVFCTKCTFTASGGAIPDFRYFILYNDTSAGKNLVGWSDRGSVVQLTNDGDSIVMRFDNLDNGGAFTIE